MFVPINTEPLGVILISLTWSLFRLSYALIFTASTFFVLEFNLKTPDPWVPISNNLCSFSPIALTSIFEFKLSIFTNTLH